MGLVAGILGATPSPTPAFFASKTYTYGTGRTLGIVGNSLTFLVQLADGAGNVTIGTHNITYAVTGPSGSVITSTLTGGSAGLYTATWSGTKTGSTYRHDIRVDGIAISGSPFTGRLDAGSASAPNSVAFGPALTNDLKASQLGQLTVRALDQFSNSLSLGGANVSVVLTHSVNPSIRANILDNNDGTYSATFNTIKAGIYTAQILLNNVAIGGGPYYVTVVPYDAFTGFAVGLLSTGRAGDMLNFTFQEQDPFGNNLFKGGVLPTVTISGLGVVWLNVSDNGDGSFLVKWNVTAPGTYTVTVKVNTNTAVSTSVAISAGPLSAARTSVYGTGLTGGLAGGLLTFTIQARDRLGNAVSGGAALFSARLFGPSIVTGSITDNNAGDGTYTVNYFCAVAGNYSLLVEIVGPPRLNITGSPFLATILPGPAGGGKCYGWGLTGGRVGSTIQFYMQVTDAFGNLLSTGNWPSTTFTIPSGAGVATVNPLVDDANGIYEAFWQGDTAGTYTYDIFVNGQRACSTPRTALLRVNTSSPSSFAYGPGLGVGYACTPFNFTIQGVDQWGNNMTVGGEAFSATINDNSGKLLAVTITDMNDGKYRAVYYPTLPGFYDFNLILNDVVIQVGNPQVVQGLIAPAPLGARASGAGLTGGVAGASLQFTVQALDACGNSLVMGGDAISAAISGPSTASVAVTDNSDGTYTVLWSAPKVGSYNIFVHLAGKNITGSPFTAKLTVGPAAPGSMRAWGAGLSGGVVGVNHTFLLQTFDAFGNNVTACCANIVVAIPNAAYAVVQDIGKGIYLVTYMSTVAGIVTTQVSLSGVAATQYITVLTPGTIVGSTSFVTVVGGTVGTRIPYVIQSRDIYGNNLISGGSVFTVSIPGAVYVSPAVDVGDGTYAGWWNGTVATTYFVDARLGGVTIGSGPQAAVLVADIPSPLTSFAFGSGLTGGVVGTPLFFTLQAQDRFGNNETADVAGFILTIPNAAFSVSYVSGGRYSVEWSGTVSGPRNISIALSGPLLNLPLATSPYRAVLLSASVVNTTTTVLGGVVYGGVVGVLHNFTVVAFDAFGNRVVVGGAPLIVSIPGATQITTMDRGDGTYWVSWTGTVSGPYVVSVQLSGAEINGSLYTTALVPDVPYALTTTASGPGLAGGAAGADLSFWVTLHDRFGNLAPVTGANVTVVIPGSTWVNVMDLANGSYAVTWSAVMAGTHPIWVLLAGANILNSPFTATITPIDTQPLNSTAFGLGLVGGIVGEPQRFQVQVRDIFGNTPILTGANVSIAIPGNANLSFIEVLGWPGLFNVTWSGTVAGPYSVSVMLNGWDIFSSPYTVGLRPAAPSALHSISFGDGLAGGVAGMSLGFYVQLRDRFSNNVTDTGFNVTVLVPTSTEQINVTDVGWGMYFVQWGSTRAGPYTVSVLLNGRQTAGSRFAATVVPGVAVADTSVTTGLRGGVVGTTLRFIVRTEDIFGNNCTVGGAAVVVTIPGSTQNVMTDLANGRYLVTWSGEVAGVYNVDVMVNGGNLSGSPFAVTLLPGASVAANSVVLYAVNLTAGVPATAYVQLRDQFFNNITVSGEPLLAAFSGGPATVTDLGGRFTVVYSGTTAGLYSLDLSLRGLPVALSAYPITIWPGPRSAVTSTLTAMTPYVGTVGDTMTATITLRDVYGNANPMGGAQLLAWVPGSAFMWVTDLGGGVFTLTWNGTVARNYYLNVTLGPLSVSGSPLQAYLGPGPADPLMSTAIGTGLRTGVAGDLLPIRVQLRDSYGNNLTASTTTVALNITGANALTSDNTTNVIETLVFPLGNGQYDIAWMATVAGPYVVTPTVNGVPINGAPFYATVVPGTLSPSRTVVLGASGGVVGTLLSFLVQTSDALGNNLTLSNSTIIPVIPGATFIRVLPQGGGRYLVMWNATTATDYGISLFANGNQIDGTPIYVTLVPGPPSTLLSVAAGTGLAGGTAGEILPFTITLYDRFSNRITTGPFAITLNVTGTNAISRGAAMTQSIQLQADGTYSVQWATNTAGIYLVSPLIALSPINGSPFRAVVVPGPIDPTTTLVAGAGVFGGTVGRLLSFTVQTRDTLYNNVTAASVGGLYVDIPGATFLQVADKGNGRYFVTWNGTVATSYQVSIITADTHVPGSPFSATLVPGAPSALVSYVTDGTGLVGGIAGATLPVSVQITDQFGNYIPSSYGAVVSLNVTGAQKSNLASVITKSVTDLNGNGAFYLPYSATLTGYYDVVPIVNGAAIGGLKYKALITAGPLNAPTTVALGPGVRGGTAGQSLSFIIRARDVFGNNITTGGDEISVSIAGLETPTVTDRGDGSYLVNWIGVVSGNYSIVVLANGAAILGSPFAAYLAPAAALATTTVLYGVAAVGTAGTSQHFLVQATDVFGNNVTAGAVGVTMTASVKGGTVTLFENLGGGLYQGAWVSAATGTFYLNVTLRGVPVVNAPAAVVLLSAPSLATNGLAFGAGLAGGVVGTPLVYSVLVRDQFGNNLTTTSSVTAVISGAGSTLQTTTLIGTGLYSTVWQGTVAGTYTISVLIDGTSIGTNYTATLVPGAAVGPRSTPAGAATTGGVAGATLTALVTGFDKFGNRVPSGGQTVVGTLVSTATGGPSYPVTALDNGDGTYTVSYTALVAGTYIFNVTLDGARIVGSPFTSVKILPSTMASAPSGAVASGSGMAGGTVGKTITFVIQTYDVYGNKLITGGAGFVFTALPSTLTLGITDYANGTYLASFRGTVATSYVMSVFYADGVSHVTNSPFVATLAADIPSPVTTLVTGTGLLGGLASTTLNFTIKAVDVFGNVRKTGGSYFYVAVGDPEPRVLTPVDNGDGTYFVQWGPTTPGRYTFNVTTAALHVTGSPFSLARPLPPDAVEAAVAAEVAASWVRLTWSAPYDYGFTITRYLITVSTSPEFWRNGATKTTQTLTVNSTTPTVNVTGLWSFAHYYVRVAAFNLGGSSLTSATGEFYTATDPVCASLSAPTYSTVLVSWSYPTSRNGSLLFYVVRYTGAATANSSGTTYSSVVVASNETSTTISGLSAVTTYSVDVLAVTPPEVYSLVNCTASITTPVIPPAAIVVTPLPSVLNSAQTAIVAAIIVAYLLIALGLFAGCWMRTPKDSDKEWVEASRLFSLAEKYDIPSGAPEPLEHQFDGYSPSGDNGQQLVFFGTPGSMPRSPLYSPPPRLGAGQPSSASWDRDYGPPADQQRWSSTRASPAPEARAPQSGSSVENWAAAPVFPGDEFGTMSPPPRDASRSRQ